MNRLRTPHIVTLVAAVIVLLSLVLLRFPARSTSGQQEIAEVRATRTSTPTPLPPTNTPTAIPTSTPTNTPTEVPPTATPVPPTATPVPPTNTPEPTAVPPTAVPVPPTAVPQPVDVLSSIELPNVDGDNGLAVVNYGEDWGNTSSGIYVTAGDGHRYQCEIGFLSRPESIQRAQEYWSYAQRGGGAWSWIIRVRESPNWAACDSDRNVCYEGKDNGRQLQVNSELYLKSWVWESLVNDWLAGGWSKVAQNGYYASIQHGLFKYVIDVDTIDTPIIGFRFTRVD